MKISKLFLIAILVIAVMTSATTVFAAGDHNGPPDTRPPSGPRGHHKQLSGEVTVIADDSLTLLTADDETVTVNVSDETKVRIVETHSEGSLEDIEIGDYVHVGVKKDADDGLSASVIAIQPDGDRLGGKVTGVANDVITVENRDGESSTIVTDTDTVFRSGEDEIAIEDIVVGMHAVGFGELQDDGSLDADLVLVAPKRGGYGRPGKPDKPAGQG
ncbi:MAG: hypothetical protein GY759_17915 [Chloroflexi bacterium]|nr:hypothetical protein [Chloroflexota bacterium]